MMGLFNPAQPPEWRETCGLMAVKLLQLGITNCYLLLNYTILDEARQIIVSLDPSTRAIDKTIGSLTSPMGEYIRVRFRQNVGRLKLSTSYQ